MELLFLIIAIICSLVLYVTTASFWYWISSNSWSQKPEYWILTLVANILSSSTLYVPMLALLYALRVTKYFERSKSGIGKTLLLKLFQDICNEDFQENT